jgi:hypothetical protein
MKRIRTLGGAIVVGLLLLGLASAGHAAVLQSANLHDFPAGTSEQAGAGRIVRTEDAVSAYLSMGDLDARAAYTVWWVVWNNPGDCVDGCGLDDIGLASIFYATGFVTGPSGTANASAHLEAGDYTDGIEVLLDNGGLALGNGLGAELHMIVRTHGRVIRGRVAEMISTVGGACDVNLCDDQQAIAFPPAE